MTAFSWGRLPGVAGCPPGGGVPPGVRLPAAGARSISFSAEKETGLDSKEKVRPVYGGFLVVHGGLRLYALFGDQPRPLRPCHWETGKRLWFYLGAAWLCHSRGRVRRWRTGALCLFLCPTFSFPAARDAPDYPGPERGIRRRRTDRAQASPCSLRAGRNGRKGFSMSYESRWPPFPSISPA